MLKPSRLALLFVTLLLTGCITDDNYSKVVADFQLSSTKLASEYRSLILAANITEQNAFIDEQVFEAQPVDPATIQAHAILTDDEIALRTAAIKALADYTCALATLAAGKPAAQIQADAAKASTSLTTLTTDASAAIAKASPNSTTPNFSGPVSTAATAIGDVLGFIERHRGEAEVKESIRKNDPQLTALFTLLGTESTLLYQRRKSALGQTGVIVFRNYAVARGRAPANSVELLQLSDRIKQYERDNARLGASDPAPAILCFKDAHDKLVKAILAPKDQKKLSLAELITSVKSLADQVAAFG